LYPVDPKKSTNLDTVIFFEIRGGSILFPVKECGPFTFNDAEKVLKILSE
jgi:hypothetical protein